MRFADIMFQKHTNVPVRPATECKVHSPTISMNNGQPLKPQKNGGRVQEKLSMNTAGFDQNASKAMEA